MCCLKYEEDHYEATRKKMPKIGKEVITPDGNGTVVDLNILKETVRVRIPKGDSTEQKDYPMDQVQRLHPSQRNKAEESHKPAPDGEEPVMDEENSVLVAQEEYVEENEFPYESIEETEDILPDFEEEEIPEE